MEPVTIQYTLTADDYVRSVRLFQSRKRSYYWIQAAYFLIAAGIVTGFLAWAGKLDNEVIWLPYVLMVIAFLTYLWAGPEQQRSIVQKNKDLILPGRWEVSEQDVTVKTALVQNSYAWQNFSEFYENDHYFYLVLKKNKKAFMFVPKRGFVSDYHKEQFRELCRRQLPSPAKK